MANEVKTVFTSEDQTSANAKTVANSIKDVGEESKKTDKDVETLGDRLSKMNSRELAEKILSIAQNFDHLGDIIEGVAENDINKFETGMDAAVRATVGVVGLVAPQFAPLVAIIGTATTKIAEWALGMEDAREKAEQLKAQHDGLITSLQRGVEIEKALATSASERAAIAFNAAIDEIDAAQQAYAEKKKLGLATVEDRIKADAEIAELQHKARLAEIEMDKAFAEEKLKLQKETNERIQEAQQQHQEEVKKADDEFAKTAIETSRMVADGLKEHAEETARKKAESAKAAAKAVADAAKAESDAAKKLTEDQKKAAAEQEKIAEAHAAKTVATASSLAQTLIGTQGSLKDKLVALAKQLTDMLGVELEKQLTAAIAGQSKQAASAVAGSAAKKSAALGAIGPEVAEAHAGIPWPLGPILAGLALVAFQVIASKVMNLQEGFVGDGRAPGLGRADDIDARINARESVMNEGAPEAIGRAFLERANRGTLGDMALAGAGAPMALDVVVRFEGLPSDDTIVGQLMRRFNASVLKRNGELVASSFHSRSGKAL